MRKKSLIWIIFEGLAWAILEYVLMAYSIAAAVVNFILLASIGVAMTGPNVRINELV